MPSLMNNVPEPFYELIREILDECMAIGHDDSEQLEREINREVTKKFFVFEIPELAPEVVQVKNNKLWLDGEPANKHCDLEPEHWLEIFIPREFEAIKQAIIRYVRNKEVYVALHQIKADEEYREEQISQEIARIKNESGVRGVPMPSISQIIRELAERRVADRESNGN